MKKIRLILGVFLLGTLGVNAQQQATSMSKGANNDIWEIKGGGQTNGSFASLYLDNNLNSGGDLRIESGFNHADRKFGNLSLSTYGNFSVTTYGVFSPVGKFSFIADRGFAGGLVPTKFGIGTKNPTNTLHLDNLANRDGIKFGEKFLIRQNTVTDKDFVMEHLQGGDLYIRSRFNPLQGTGNIVLNDYGGTVGIGTNDTKGYKLGVKGKIAAEEVKVAVYPWADFVFETNYNLPTLTEVEQHIAEKGHLKDIPSAAEVQKNGIFLGDMNAKLLQKIEELTLYTIEQEKKIQSQAKSFELLQSDIEFLKKELQSLKKK